MFVFLDENTSVELTGVTSISELDQSILFTDGAPVEPPAPSDPGPTGPPQSVPGTEAADNLIGSNLNDFLNGGAGDDTLDGGAGNDILLGGQGNDLLIGNEGADVFAFDSDSGFSRIADFNPEEGDIIDLFGTELVDFADINLVEDNGVVFVYIDEDTSIEITGFSSIDQLNIESDFFVG